MERTNRDRGLNPSLTTSDHYHNINLFGTPRGGPRKETCDKRRVHPETPVKEPVTFKIPHGLSMFYEQCTVSMQSHTEYGLKKHGTAIAPVFNFSSKFSRTVEKADCARKKKAPRAAGRDFPSQLNDQRKLGQIGDRFPALLLRSPR